MRYVVTGLNIMDRLSLPDGTLTPLQMGGAPIYGYSGIRLYDDRVTMVLRIGADFDEYYGAWYDRNGIDRSGLKVVSRETPYCIMRYHLGAEGTTGLFSTGDWRDSAFWRPQGGDLSHAVGPDTKAVCLAAGPGVDAVWTHLLQLREQYGFSVMWEPINMYTQAEHRDLTLAICEKVDMASFNVTEAMRIFSLPDEAAVVEFLKQLSTPMIFLRAGAKGSYVIAGDDAVFVPSLSIDSSQVADTTGCGNCSTAAACWAWCEGYSPSMTAALANTAAGINLLQNGPLPQFTPQLRAEAMELAQNLIK